MQLPSPAALRHVLWIGGGSGAGKSAVARSLSSAHGLRLYSSDVTLADHAGRSSPATDPLLHDFLAMDMDERWVHRPPRVMWKTFYAFRGEGFERIVEDLLALPTAPPVLVEGFRVLPRLVAPLLERRDQAIWLTPTRAFRRAAFEARGFTWEIPSKTSDPARALANLLARDELFTLEVKREAKALDMQVIDVDVGVALADVTALVADALGLSRSQSAGKQRSAPG